MEQFEGFHAWPLGEFMFDYRKISKVIGLLAMALLFCSQAYAQQQTDRGRRKSEQGRNEYGVEQAPDLTQENLARVAASATQIRTVLVKDEGLMVELKRWVAKEATDNGQVVEDSNLTDHAIFERLEQDVAFRSVATRLLQRYGYLMPTPNPDSDFAKEKELVLKERARRLVQIESQEDTDSLRPQKNDRDVERTTTCDPRSDEDCPQQPPADRRQKMRTRGAMPSPEANPQGAPEQIPSQNASRILQADGLPQGPELRDGASFPTELELTSSPIKRDTNPFAGSQPKSSGAIDGLPLGRDGSSVPLERTSGTEAITDKNGMEQPLRPRTAQRRANEEDVTPVRMVHRANPYADIPSLFDMYVQTSAHQRPTERF